MVEKIKDYMDEAVTAPVRISRRDGQSFILMSEQIYEDFRSEVQSLQCRLLGMKEILNGETRPLTRGEDRLARLKVRK